MNYSRFAYLIIFLMLTAFIRVSGQSQYNGPIQLSGVVVTEEQSKPVKMPYVTVAVENTARGTYTNWDGFFSLVVEKGETVVFTHVGFRPVKFKVPDTLTTNRYTVFQILYQDDIWLPETVIYPWPNKDNYRVEFLAMDVNSDIISRVQENLDASILNKLYDKVPVDGKEAASASFRQYADNMYSYGQQKPIGLLNIFAWQQFIENWKKGVYKKKKKKED